MPQTSFQQVSYPGFGQQNPQVFAFQNNPYMGYQQQIPYAGAQRPVAQAIPSYPGYAQPDLNRKLPFVATLELPDLNRLTNDPINYAPWWPVIPHKLPSDIPKFNGNLGEDLSTHVMTYHFWCSSNSLNNDSVRLRLFQRTITGLAAEGYIE